MGVILSFVSPQFRSINRTVNKYMSQLLKPTNLLPGKNRIHIQNMILLVDFIKKERIDSFVSYLNKQWENYLNDDSSHNVICIHTGQPYSKNRFAFKAWFWLKKYKWNTKLSSLVFSECYIRKWNYGIILQTNGHFEFSLIHKVYGYLSTSKFIITRSKEFSWELNTFDEVSGIKCIKY